MPYWVDVCALDDMALGTVRRFDHGTQTYAIYRCPAGKVYATSGYCTHQRVHLAEGVIINEMIECPKHQGCFNYQNGAALGAPVFQDLTTFATDIVAGRLYLQLPDHA
jgi:3-phenylpropionate/trans-cinnamate dioxygenase ferredoxin subunit